MAASGQSIGGSGLLLRLFESEFFNVHLAVAYLKNYPDSIGITYYLIARLSQYSESDIDIYWAQLCHLLISRPTESAALEGFIIRKCQESTHLAMKTLWFLQASLSDLSATPTTTSFAICRRVFNRVQSIIFSDPLAATDATSPLIPSPKSHALAAPIALTDCQDKVAPNVLTAAVGMGLVMGGIGVPSLPRGAGRIAIEQGRKRWTLARDKKTVLPLGGSDLTSSMIQDADMDSSSGESEEVAIKRNKGKGKASSPVAHVTPSPVSATRPKKKKIPFLQSQPDYTPGPSLTYTPPPTPPSATKSPHLAVPPPPPLRRTNSTNASAHASSQPTISSNSRNHSPITPKMPNLSNHADSRRTNDSRSNNSPVAQCATVQHKSVVALHHQNSRAVSQSVPSLPFSRSTAHLSPYPSLRPDPIATLSIPVLRNVLRSHAMRSQLDLLTSLQDISTRLVVVPKMARLSALRAELTVLNHGLPRGCCLGMFCPGEGGGPPTSEWLVDESRAAHPLVRAHHRIVRISPNESVVLNSADRAPFLIHVEVLEGDLDFDPKRRQNAEDLRRALGGEAGAGFGKTLSKNSGSCRHRDETSSRGSLDQGLDSLRRSPLPSPLLPSTSMVGSITPLEGSSPRRSTFSDASSSAPMAGFRSQTLPVISDRNGLMSSLVSEDRDLPSATFSVDEPGTIQELSLEEPEDEVDLVEQLYGSSSLRKVPEIEEDTESYFPSIQNRAIDEAAWMRATITAPGNPRRTSSISSLPSPSVAKFKVNGSTPVETSFGSSIHDATLSAKTKRRNSAAGGSGVGAGKARLITLDEYAERMRMAAIMLAQLKASEQFGGATGSTAGAAAGHLVGGAIGLGASVGAGLGGAVGAGLGAVVNALSPAGRRDSASAQSAGQSSSGIATRLDTARAASGLSAVSGTAPLLNGAGPITPPSDATMTTQVNGLTNEKPAPNSVTSVAPSSQQHSRQRVLTAQQSQAIKDRIMTEMMGLEEERMERMRWDSLARSSGWTSGREANVTDEAVVMRAVNKDDPSGSMLGESWADKRTRIRAASPYGHLVNWDVYSCIVKTGADLRQEQLVAQLIKEFGRIWKEENCPVWVRYYQIFVTGESTGLMETIVDAVSLHSLKKAAYSRLAKEGDALVNFTMYDYYIETFGQPSTPSYRKAQDAFLQSLVAYSIISYLLQLKDRHNGNILIDKAGHIIHIDFGFVLSNSPGSLGFEMAPFKLGQEYIDILGGMESLKWQEFISLFKTAFRDIRKHAERIITIVELMQQDSKFPCFAAGDSTSKLLRERFQLGLTSIQCDELTEKLILSSASSVFTKLYDSFQYYSQGVL